MPKCPEIDDTLVLKPKKTCWLAFDWKITIWLCGVKIKLSVLRGQNYETWISTKSCSVKLSNVPIGLLVVRKFNKPEREEKITKIWTSANLALGSGKLSGVLIALVVPKKLEKTERICPNKIYLRLFFFIKILWRPPPRLLVFCYWKLREDRSEQFFCLYIQKRIIPWIYNEKRAAGLFFDIKISNLFCGFTSKLPRAAGRKIQNFDSLQNLAHESYQRCQLD